MRKSMLRIASVLLVAVLLTTCIISGAFAKYTTTKTLENESARVARWGIEMAVDNQAAFAEQYAKTDTTATDVAAITNTVDATAADALVLAPGTEGSFGTLTITDDLDDVAREVAVRATIDVDVELDKWIVGTEVYLPVVVYINDVAINVSAAAGDDAAAKLAAIEVIMEDAIIAAIAGDNTGVHTAIANNATTGRVGVYDYAHDKDLDREVEITWGWGFNDADAHWVDTYNDDAKDTVLGNASDATIALTYTVTLDQID